MSQNGYGDRCRIIRFLLNEFGVSAVGWHRARATRLHARAALVCTRDCKRKGSFPRNFFPHLLLHTHARGLAGVWALDHPRAERVRYRYTTRPLDLLASSSIPCGAKYVLRLACPTIKLFCRGKGRDRVANLVGPIGNAPRKDEPRFKRCSELFTLLVRYVCAPAVLTTFPFRPASRARPPLPALLLSFVRASSGLLAVEPRSCACIVGCSLVCVVVALASAMFTTRIQPVFIFPRGVRRALLPATLCLVALIKCLMPPGPQPLITLCGLRLRCLAAPSLCASAEASRGVRFHRFPPIQREWFRLQVRPRWCGRRAFGTRRARQQTHTATHLAQNSQLSCA